MDEEFFIDHLASSKPDTVQAEHEETHDAWTPLDVSQFVNKNLTRFLIYQAF